jgi:hypothetical protein
MEDKLSNLEKEVFKKADKEQLRILDDKLLEKAEKVELQYSIHQERYDADGERT